MILQVNNIYYRNKC